MFLTPKWGGEGGGGGGVGGRVGGGWGGSGSGETGVWKDDANNFQAKMFDGGVSNYQVSLIFSKYKKQNTTTKPTPHHLSFIRISNY